MSKKNLESLKKVIALFMVAIWLVLIFKIFKSGGTMNQQLPKCIFTTIGVFAVLNIIIKLIEYIERKKEANS
jgi:hypothetical protein